MEDISPVNSDTNSKASSDSEARPRVYPVSPEHSAPPSPTREAPPLPWTETFTRAMAETGGPIGIANVSYISKPYVCH